MAIPWKLALATAAFLVVGWAAWQKEAPDHGVTLTWQASPSTAQARVVGYNVYRRTTPGTPYDKIAAQVPSPPYEDRNVVSGTAYVYAVTAVDQRGRESAFSTVVRAEVP